MSVKKSNFEVYFLTLQADDCLRFTIEIEYVIL